MKLGELLKYIEYSEVFGDRDTRIKGLCDNSRKIKEGELFFCYKGEKYDSHDFAEEAVKSGAAALICEKKLNLDVPQIIVKDGRAIVAAVARAYYGFADEKLKLVGVTGTNGKTTDRKSVV